MHQSDLPCEQDRIKPQPAVTTWGTLTEIPSLSDGESESGRSQAERSERSKHQRFYTLAIVAACILILLGVVISILLMSKVEKNFKYHPTSAPSFIPIKPSNITVGVYYYPWYFTDFHSNGPYLRNQLEPPQYPTLGEYNDHDTQVITQHLAWSRQANIKLWVTSWWGPNRREDNATLKILQHKDLGDNKIALFFESSRLWDSSNVVTTENVVADMDHICEKYFGNEHYFTIDGRPVLFLYLSRKLYALNSLAIVVDLMRYAAVNHGFDPYIIGDQVFGDAPVREEGFYPPFHYLDGVTGYDVFGSLMSHVADKENPPLYAGMEHVSQFTQQSREWKRLAQAQSCTFIPTATPGYSDRAKDSGRHSPLSRRLTADHAPGSLFRALLADATYMVDELTSNLLMVNSFNEWHEDTQIEPTVASKSTVLPLELTQGVAYEGYGTLYLDILRNMTEDEEKVDSMTNTTSLNSTSVNSTSMNATTSNIAQYASGLANMTSNGTSNDFINATYDELQSVLNTTTHETNRVFQTGNTTTQQNEANLFNI